jgi:hypothetical protein
MQLLKDEFILPLLNAGIVLKNLNFKDRMQCKLYIIFSLLHREHCVSIRKIRFGGSCIGKL